MAKVKCKIINEKSTFPAKEGGKRVHLGFGQEVELEESRAKLFAEKGIVEIVKPTKEASSKSGSK